MQIFEKLPFWCKVLSIEIVFFWHKMMWAIHSFELQKNDFFNKTRNAEVASSYKNIRKVSSVFCRSRIIKSWSVVRKSLAIFWSWLEASFVSCIIIEQGHSWWVLRKDLKLVWKIIWNVLNIHKWDAAFWY